MRFPDETPRLRRYLTFVQRSPAADIDEELRFHFESRIEELIAEGMTPSDARARAIGEFGDVSAVRHGLVEIGDRVARRRDRSEWFRGLVSDATYAVRSLRRTPGVAMAILATLALGVGANAAMFTLLDAIFLRPPAGVVDPAGTRRLWMEHRFRTGRAFSQIVSYIEFDAIRTALQDRARIVLYRTATKTKVGLGETAGDAQVSYANADYFTLLGVKAGRGRLYSPDEDRLDSPSPVVILSDAYWRRAYGADPAALGRPIILKGLKFTIVGIAAPSFSGPDLNAVDAWAPLSFYASDRVTKGPWWTKPSINGLYMLLRPAAGVSDREIEQRATAAIRRIGLPGLSTDSTSTVRTGSIIASSGPGRKLQEEQIAIRLTGVATIVLIIACANVVNLLLARAVRRRREIAVRLALGIARGRLIRLLVSESVVLAIIAAVLAVIFAYWGGTALRSLLMPDVHWASSPLDWRVIALALATALGAGLIAGLIPALQSANPDLTNVLKIGAGSGAVQHSRLRAALVIAQSSLSVLLMVGAMLFIRSLANVRGVDIGYDASSVVTAYVRFDDPSRSNDPSVPPRLAELAQRLESIAGVEHVAVMSMPPMEGFSTLDWYTETDSSRAQRTLLTTVTAVSGDYFGAVGLKVLRGETFPTSRAAATAPTVVVSDSLARALWRGRSAIGQCMWFGKRASTCYRVIGVVENARMGSIVESEDVAQYYLPFGSLPQEAKRFLDRGYIALHVVPTRYPAVAAEVRALIREQFPGGIPVLRRLSDYIDPQYRPWRLGATLFTAFGVLALIVSVIGIYSTVAYGVNQRIHEFGVRIALGATLGTVLRLVVGASLRVVAVGVVIGVAITLLAGRFIASLLYGVSPGDPITIGQVTLLLLAVGAFAALAPAWRASRVDPVTALRAD